MKIKVRFCSACGDNHEIDFNELEMPETIDNNEFTHAGLCPNTKILVYMRPSQEDKHND